MLAVTVLVRAATAMRHHRQRPALFMLLAVAFYMLLPLVIWRGVQHTTSWVFVGIWYLVSLVLHGAAMQVLRPSKGISRLPLVLTDVLSVKPRYFWSLTVLRTNWLLFAGAVALAPAAAVTIIYEVWPVVFAASCLTSWWRNKMLNGEPLNRSVAVSTLVLLTVGVSGVALAVLSETASDSWSRSAAAGMLLAILACLAHALSAGVSQVLGTTHYGSKDIAPAYISSSAGAAAGGVLGLVFLLAALTWGGLVGGSINISWRGAVLATVASALQVFGNLLFQHANHLARDAGGQRAPQVNSLFYLVPVGAVLLLAWFADTDIARPDLLITGLAGVVAVNMVMHLDPEGALQRRNAVGAHG